MWDTALRLRRAVARTYIGRQFSPLSCGRLFKDRRTRRQLEDVANEFHYSPRLVARASKHRSYTGSTRKPVSSIYDAVLELLGKSGHTRIHRATK
jgi:hypothetical protein